jgi:hypothetical protein
MQRSGIEVSTNIFSQYTYTPLMGASFNSARVEVIETLIRLGADYKLKDGSGKTAQVWMKESRGNSRIQHNYLDSFAIFEALSSVYIKRLGRESPLRYLPKELLRSVRDALVLETKSDEKQD